jgi:outer membrane protein with beta-barrel domain
MKGIVKGLVVAGLGLALTASVVAAQKPGVELGVTLAGFSMISPDGGDKITVFNVGSASFGGVSLSPGSGVTAAFYLNEMIAIEPQLGFGYAKDEGASDGTSILGLQVGVPIYLKKEWGKGGGLFITPFLGMTKISSGGTSSSQNHFGANVGTKLRISDNVFWRIQAGVDMGMENSDDGIPKTTSFGGAFGLNVYLR